MDDTKADRLLPGRPRQSQARSRSSSSTKTSITRRRDCPRINPVFPAIPETACSAHDPYPQRSASSRSLHHSRRKHIARIEDEPPGFLQPGSFATEPSGLQRTPMSASLIGRSRIQALSDYPPLQCRCRSRGSRFSSGIGTKALRIGFEGEEEQSIQQPCRQDETAGPSGHANSPHPSSREGSSFPPLGGARVLNTVGFQSCRVFMLLPQPVCRVQQNFGAKSRPDAVHDHGQPAR